jgi:pyridoxal phosphate enzyme (YggS family)
MQPIEEPKLSASLIAERYRRLMVRLRTAAEAAGRDPDGFRVVAVTKGFDAPVVRLAREAGLDRFGENRVQEAALKVAAAPDAEWHLIGRLQANKVRPAVGLFAVIHSIDSLDLLSRVDRIAGEEGRRPIALLQVNLSGEPTKAGFDSAWFAAELRSPGPLVAALRGLGAVEVTGLMTIGVAGAPATEARMLFGRLRQLRDELALRIGRPLPDLSMGMSADAEAAVAEGATLVRIGTALFGPRPG